MIENIIRYSLDNKLLVLLFTTLLIGFGSYSLTQLPIGAVPDITNNQVQVITTTRNLATQDVEKYLTYPVELEMANLPGVKEIRSVSKFGLSVVTIVFEEDMGPYLPRQLISEKLKSAEENIPAGFGKPFMGPITTGLGEIYQYILDVKPGYEDRYTTTELRTIQDWIVRRQLSGIPGVVEVNTWGGYLKQYEVAVSPEKLRALDLDIADVYTALETNNTVAGGGYIEKGSESYFIRSEGQVQSLEDIGNIVVTVRDGIPLYIRDIANVGFGHATRFGAITGNGEGEKVLGQVMMLKDANSKAVIDAVKKRVEEIQKSLPEGVYINGFLERSELIGKTTFTVAENLTLGCLIVIFVVVLLLGNIRSGLVVASVIPLSLMFALSLMYITGVDANLMSLGAIDFGIIIDGAVIIVEFIAFRISADAAQFNNLSKEQSRELIDSITFKSSKKMMHSAVFGQLIIIIVFIPIFSLSSVEGKMFIPMAQTFCYALIGAMILCFTYVPVMSALVLKPKAHKKNFSDRLMARLENAYQPTIQFALRRKALVLSLSLSLLVATGFLFSRMGGEFVPTLDEGDFVIQPVLKTGTSLGTTIETMTEIEKILRTFPEVTQVVTRIGAAEVPTDPMSMEECDVIIRLKPKNEWVSAESKDELADKFKEALSVLPGLDFEFTQPIEMRFNELITGVRADLAIKIFGEDLDILYQKGLEVETAIQNIPGASDIILEKVAGLPQMSVTYNRSKLAAYGLSVDEVNRIISMGFAGMPAGQVFEGERHFDLVVRYDESHRRDIDNIRNASIRLNNGNQIRLREVADIVYSEGPAKISRDDTKRRIVVGVNVRGRDLESVVKDVQQVIEEKIDLPAGYSITYGGQFQNLRSARERLMIAVPVSLLLIFFLLYFAFNSVRQALLIYTAIPLSSVGGVLLLYIRGMPFSISAGVGFIALFGIAVLNGIVLIEHFKELKKEGVQDLRELVVKGTTQRLRPVLLTAAAAALGFLPMAISTSAGAEVQRPLATVVVGGLISATLLTLVVLPILYTIFERKSFRTPHAWVLVPIFFLFPLFAKAQGPGADELTSLQQTARDNNGEVLAARARVAYRKALLGTSVSIPETYVYYQFDENNIAENGEPIGVWGISQTLPFPGEFASRSRFLKSELWSEEHSLQLAERKIDKQVALHWNRLQYLRALESRFRESDSLGVRLSEIASRKYQTGEITYLEKLSAEAHSGQIHMRLLQVRQQAKEAEVALTGVIQGESSPVYGSHPYGRWELQEPDSANHPGLALFRSRVESEKQLSQLVRRQQWPDLQISLFTGTNDGPQARVYRGIEAGLIFPLWWKPAKAQSAAAREQINIAEASFENYRKRLEASVMGLKSGIDQLSELLNFYDNEQKELMKEIRRVAISSFEKGETDARTFIRTMEQVLQMEMEYLDTLQKYNQAVLELNYID